ncbi:GDP-L-fucose synthase [Arenicella xantha]|uniref:GDP-L-fucose synthase n=1 Tax=Arenicella xantha TaxID=644221 RepID=A0A395JQL8_9GAMM|nr:GDP-L-fucose synthase [Arenicella xantha]RBP52622.1 GDP-L-fucose synthase [Arenicella xantha]
MRKRVYVAGHQGMVGSAIIRQLREQDEVDIVTRSRAELDLTDQRSVNDFFASNAIDEVYHAAAKVGGIFANNTYPAEFIYQNLMVECNVVDAAYRTGVKKLVLLGSSCIYPKLAPQPMPESALLTSYLEPTNEPYAIAKIAGIKLCESYNRQYGVDYRSVMPTNLYGQNDNFHPTNSHVIPAMMLRFHNAKLTDDEQVVVWGTGSPMREFMHVDDMANATIFVMGLDQDSYDSVTDPRLTHINVGTGIDCTIRELAETMRAVVGFEGELVFDADKPDGAPRKLLDVSKLRELGWSASVSLEAGLQQTYDWFVNNQTHLRVGAA